jgi:hypothetical protein
MVLVGRHEPRIKPHRLQTQHNRPLYGALC